MFVRSKRGRKTPNDIPETPSDGFGSLHRKFFCETPRCAVGLSNKHVTGRAVVQTLPYASAAAYSIVGAVVWINGGPAQGNPPATLPLRQTYFALRYLLLKTGFRFSTKAVIASPKSLI